MFNTFSWIPTWSIFSFHSLRLILTNLIFRDLKDINSLVDKKLPIQIPAVFDKWMTTALLLHFAALIVAALSAFFGLLAHCCEMSMRCSSTYSSGFAAVIALFAFIFDLVLFFVAKARINSVGSATIGSAIWLTLAAWVLLFFSGWFYSCGKNGTSNPPSKNRGDVGFRYGNNNPKTKRSASDDGDEEFFRNVARVAAEDRRAAAEERRARQKTELGLPKMPEVQVERVPIEQQPTAVTDSQARTLLVQTLDGPIEGHDHY